MATEPTSRTSWPEAFALVLLALAPVLWLVGVVVAAGGRNLTHPLLAGLALLFLLGLRTLIGGLRHGHAGRTAAGISCLVLGLVNVVLSTDLRLWVGSQHLPLTILVRDAETQRPIPHAAVRLRSDGRGNAVTVGQTDDDGVVHLVHTFRTSGETSLVRRTGGVDFGTATLQVEAVGHRSVHEPLAKYTGLTRDLYDPPTPAIEVHLRRERP